MKTRIALSVLSALLLQTSFAQVDSVHSKLDTLVSGQKQILQMQEKIYAEVYSEPLTGKHWGLEFNPAFLLLTGASDALGLSAGLMLFSLDRGAEIAFPVYYYNKTGDKPLTHLNIDAIYRRFLGKHQEGFYISIGIRYTYLRGRDGGLIPLSSIFGGPEAAIVTQSKMGAHFGIGFRLYSESGLFWGMSIYAGRYFSGHENDITSVLTDDTKKLYDFEILKFGIAF